MFKHQTFSYLAKPLLGGIFGSLFSIAMASGTRAAASVIIVTGAPGESEFETDLKKQSEQWRDAATKGGAGVVMIGTDSKTPASLDAESLRAAFGAVKPDGRDALWLVLNGHGTWDGKTARFNLRGPDISDEELAAWLKPIQCPLVIVNTSSSSAPFIAKLSAPGRIVITATRSGSEHNLTRFGTHLAAVLTEASADLDTDGSISLLEAFLAAARRTAEFYKTEGRLATEHALIDDNGDGLGTPADWFKGLRAVKKSDKNAAPDGGAARHFFLTPPPFENQWPEELFKEREILEAKLAALREVKATMKDDDYYAKIESLLVELARLAQKASAGRQ